MSLLDKHLWLVFPLGLSFVAISFAGLAIWGSGAVWMFFFVPFAGLLVFYAIGDWLESETRARWKRARRARRQARSDSRPRRP